MAEMEMLNQLPTASSDRSYKFSDDTLRDTSTKYLTGALSGLGMSDANALRFARDFTGRTDMDDIGQSLGVLDFTPAGLVYGVDEAVDQFQAAEKPIDYIAPTVGLGLSAVEAFPATKIMTKPLRGFLKNLGNKYSEKTYYHGSDVPNIKKFDVNKPQVSSNIGETKPTGVTYFTSDRNYAEGYGDNIYEVKIKEKDIFDENNPEHAKKFFKAAKGKVDDDDLEMLGEYETMEMPEIKKILKDLGFRGYVSNETSPSVGLFYPNEDTKQLRGFLKNLGNKAELQVQ